jgi:enterochelin esterase-like enzyme
MTTRRGTVSDIEIDSRAVGRAMEVRVITPPGYDDDLAQVYPVLYFLHPWGLNPRYITDKLNIHLHAQRGAANGSLAPMLIVLPTGYKSFYMNAADPPGHDWTPVIESHDEFFHDALDQYGQYGDYLLEEVIPHIETHYRVRTDRAGRAIGGISMGGAAAAVHAFRDPSRFSAVGIHSPALFSGPPENPGPPWIFGLDRESFAARNPADVARSLTPNTQPRIWLDTGSGDAMRDVVEHLHRVLEDRGIKHEFAINPGGHNKAYWEPLMSAYLAFYAQEWLKM